MEMSRKLREGSIMRGNRRTFLAGCAALFLAFLPISGQSQVVINELMYHPEDGWHTNASGAWVNFTNETEYVEIYNAGTNAVDLSTYRLDNGVSFDFPPGAMLATGSYLIVCQNISAFKNVYTNVQWTTTNCLGNYKGTLNNGGERVTLSRLVDTQWVEVASIKYLDGGLADGHGYSLELIHSGFSAFRDQFHGAWAASMNAGIVVNNVRYGGTPGRANSVYNSNALPVVGDVLHAPPLPPAGSVVLITCRAGAYSPGMLDRVYLLWRWDQLPQTNFNVLQMYDDGYNGDVIAGDGIYSRVFPPFGYPTNSSGQTTTNGQLLEFLVTASQSSGGAVTNPVVSAANTTNSQYSYLCYFGEDADFTGEYATYHMLMTQSNKAIVEAQGPLDDGVRRDGTFISSAGEIFYNSGFRHRGGSSTYSPYNYKIRLPAGRDLDGLTSFDLNHLSAMYQYIGMKIMGSIGYGVEAPNVKLCRLWLNGVNKDSLATAEAGHKMYVRHEAPMDQDFAKSHYGSDYGNFYFTDGDTYSGRLTYSTDINSYKTLYNSVTNYPPMAWSDLSNLCWIVDQAPSAFVTNLTNRLDPREWGRYFGGQMAIDNAEAGLNAPAGDPFDEMRLYSGSEDGIFRMIPHDCDLILQGDSSDVWGWNVFNTSDVIENEPTVKFYRHDCLEIASNVMSDVNMNILFDEMGSAASGFRGTWLSNIQNQRGDIQLILGSRDAGPTAPTNMVLTNVTAVSVEVQWQDAGIDEEWFEIWRSKDGTSWKYRAYVESNITAYVDVGLSENTAYLYKVRAVDQHGESAFAGPVSVTTPFLTSDALLRDFLRVTEIMYNPTNSSGYEFIELMNSHSTQPIDLSGVYFTPGEPFTDSFVFTNGTSLGPGAFLVLVGNATSFTNRYPGVSYYGQYTGGMGNDGEQIRIRATNAATIIDFIYHDWYPAADGVGCSLVLWDPLNTANDPTSIKLFDRMEHSSLWRPSTYMYGSPGSNDPAPPFGAVVINEVLTHQDQDTPGDWIELYNPTTNAINIGYWCLSDDVNVLTNYRIAPGTVIGPGGYFVVTERWGFGTNVLGTNGFALSELGERFYMSSGSTNGLTSYRTSVDFGAGERDVTFGRYTRSDGEVDFVAMSRQTSNNANAYPSVGPVVINEIMYNPSAGGKEYVELYNLTSTNIPLFDTNNVTATWNFDGAMDFTFPTNTYIGPYQYLLVVGTTTNEFRAMYGMTNPAIQVFGPYTGDLANNGESIKLYKPGSPETNGFVPRIRVDRVQYDDALPWPVEADNGGASLERRAPAFYGNDPSNWVARTMFGTPGGPNNTNGLPTVNFATTGASGYESNQVVKIIVTLTPAATNSVSVWYGIGGGTATPGVDYMQSNGVVTFAAGETSNLVSLVISNDVAQETDETVLVTLTNVTASAWLGGNSRFTWTIIDTDATVLAVPVIAPAGTNAFTHFVSVTITSPVPYSTIFYTTDGSIPTYLDRAYTGAVVLTSSARITARSYLGSYQNSSWSTALFVEQAPPWETDPNIGVIRIGATTDEAVESSLSTKTDTPYLPIGTNYVWTGVRFTNINIGKSVVVTNAYIQFAVYEVAGTNAMAEISGQLTNDATAFVSGSGKNVSSRTRTTNSVLWNMSTNDAWGPLNSAGESQRSPSLSGIMNEIISITNWAAGNSMVFVWINKAGTRKAHSYYGNTNFTPVLHYWTATQEVQQYWLTVLTNGTGMGTITGGNRWVLPGSNVNVSASVNPHYQFTGWTGTVAGISSQSSPSINVPMTNNRTLWGNFRDIFYTNGVTEAWLQYYFQGTNDFTNAAVSDTDGDGHQAWQEFVAGTDPTNEFSVLRVIETGRTGGWNTISWPAVTGKVYSIYKSTNLLYTWPGSSFTNNLSSATNGTVSFSDAESNNPAFYRIIVQ